MEQPPGYEEFDPQKYCIKLYKSIYGLKQARHKLYEIVCLILTDSEFKKCETDPAIFYIHVNDFTMTGPSDDLIQSYKLKIKSKYDLMNLVF